MRSTRVTVRVTGCENCPYYENTPAQGADIRGCRHPSVKRGVWPREFEDGWKQKLPPKWCPLGLSK